MALFGGNDIRDCNRLPSFGSTQLFLIIIGQYVTKRNLYIYHPHQSPKVLFVNDKICHALQRQSWICNCHVYLWNGKLISIGMPYHVVLMIPRQPCGELTCWPLGNVIIIKSAPVTGGLIVFGPFPRLPPSPPLPPFYQHFSTLQENPWS